MSDHYSSGEREAALVCGDGACTDEWNEAHPDDRISVTEWAAYQAKMDAAAEQQLSDGTAAARAQEVWDATVKRDAEMLAGLEQHD